jgi:hypothetical protein
MLDYVLTMLYVGLYFENIFVAGGFCWNVFTILESLLLWKCSHQFYIVAMFWAKRFRECLMVDIF